MKSAGGMRGMYAAVAKAVMSMTSAPAAVPSILERPPGFMGVGPKDSKCMLKHKRGCNNGGHNKPHQGAQECARRRRQMGLE